MTEIKSPKSFGPKDFFPIKTATACQSKWTWSTIWLNQGATSSCHRVTPIPLNFKNFDNFHNLPKKIHDRQLMLRGEWPRSMGNGCEYCKDIEDAGGWSDRQHNLDIPGLTPEELDSNPTEIYVTPRIVEIFARNTCNLSCVYCNANLSSKIEQENIKFGEFNKDGVTILGQIKKNTLAQEYLEKFYSWLEKNGRSLRRLHLLGGETLIQHDLIDRVVEILDDYPNPDLELGIFSNFSISEKVFQRHIVEMERLYSQNKISRFDLTASIDAWGPEIEYTRSGLDLELFEKNFKYVAEQEWIRLNVNQTVTTLTMRSMPDLIDKITFYSNNDKRHIGHYFQFVTGFSYLHPEIYGGEFWKNDFDRIFQAMPADTDDQKEARQRMEGMRARILNTQMNTVEIKKMKTYLDEIDRRRKTNWKNVFPYLDIEVENVV
jgi:pyruvate-formate lyase-activating enzyme